MRSDRRGGGGIDRSLRSASARFLVRVIATPRKYEFGLVGTFVDPIDGDTVAVTWAPSFPLASINTGL